MTHLTATDLTYDRAPELTAIRRVLHLPATARIEISRRDREWDDAVCYYSGLPAAIRLTWYTTDDMTERDVAVENIAQALADAAEDDPHTLEVTACWWWARYNANPEQVLTTAA